MAEGETARDRAVIAVSGEDRESFLQGLVTNDVCKLALGPVYAALLTPQGKYLTDFLMIPDGERILLDVHEGLAEGLLARLMLYRLRARVALERLDLPVSRGLGPAPEDAVADPRHPALGWRRYGREGESPRIDWDAIRVAHVVPESLIELRPEETYILEAGFERLNGVDFHKGCYVGQEVTARMKHKTSLRKGLVQVEIDAPVPPGTEILRQGRPVGRVFTHSGGRALAHLAFDRAGDGMEAAGVPVRWNGARPG